MTVEHVQTKREVEALLAARGLRPNKRLGQHFLIDGNLMRRLVASADIGADDVVLEVGAGTGALTDLLARRAGGVICVEIDRGLAAMLADRFAGSANVTVVHGDVLERKHRIHGDVATLIRRGAVGPAGCVKLVANLPYQVATPVIMNLLVGFAEVGRLCFTVQAEVGERITASPGRKTYGPLGIVAKLLADVKTVARMPAEAFWPRPAVASVMLRMDVRASPPVDRGSLPDFVAFVRAMFDHRRKTVRAALAYVVDDADAVLDTQDLDPKRRPESLNEREWIALHAAARGG